MKEIEFDYERAAALLNIVQLVAGVAPGFTSISSEAMAELKEMNDTLFSAQRERTAELQAARDAEAAERAQEAREEGEDQGEDTLGEPVPTPAIDHTKTVESKPPVRRTL
jgi:flagellar biosynthesis/type III secretory pathway protein FliH